MLSVVKRCVFLLIVLTVLSCKTLQPEWTPVTNSPDLPGDVTVLGPEAWNGIDDTQALQAVLDSESAVVLIQAAPGPWVTDPLFIVRDNLTLYFEEGAVIQAKKGSYQDGGDSLISVENQENISIIGLGTGGVLRMLREDYDNPPYKKAEWRHGLNFRSVKNLLVRSMTIEETGGDGIYLGMSTKEGGAEYMENVVIEGCLIRNNYRQGISVISINGLLIDNCEILNTKGTLPEAAVDFEPNRDYQRLTDCVIRDSRLQGNRGPGVLIWLKKLNSQSTPIDIRIENSNLKKNPLGLNIGALGDKPTGTVELKNVELPLFNLKGRFSSLDVNIEK